MNITNNINSNDQLFIDTLKLLQKQLTYTVLVSLFIIGNIGCILNTMIFRCSNLILSSCSHYFLASSLANVFQLNIGLASTILDFGFNIHPFHTSSILCKFRNYSINIGGFLSQTYILLACIDRYLVSVNKTRYRQILTITMAHKIIYFIVCFWSISLSHMIIYSNISLQNQFCYYSNSIYVIFISLHNLILSGFILPILMVIFGLLTLRNIRIIRQRAHARRNHKQRNHYLSLMLITNVFVSVIFTLLYTSGLIYISYFIPSKENSYRQKMQIRFISFIAIIFYYTQYSLSFYVNILTSQRFRCELKKFLHSKRKQLATIFRY
ncbi:unnamed protein product [Adineta steineri]|uniref:G-protein coupled receptors family 1 profile domain-containing protein n=1 Tax=Adineta steineri TaxID=433720 RepID=A0A819L3Q1_9BILA|nr:unnamed protein product [Adineta steineri]CAF3959562.1 unnamed protein product [Adineta steineri]